MFRRPFRKTLLLVDATAIKEDVLTAKKNLAGRVGAWSIRHRKAAIIGWFVFVIAAFHIGSNMGMQEKDPSDQVTGETGRATKILQSGWPQDTDSPKSSEQVLVESKSLDAKDPQFKAAVADAMSRLDGQKYISKLEDPYT